MPEGVVDFLEFIEVNEHYGKRTSGARSSLPLRTEGFPEKAAGLDASKTIGDGSLLQLLKYKRIVERRSQEVGQGVHDQNIFGRERILLPAFDVKHAQQGLTISDGDAEHRSRIGQYALQWILPCSLYQSPLAGSRYSSEDAHAEWNSRAHSFRGDAGFGLDFDVFANVIENADTDVIEAEGFLDVTDNLQQHLFGVSTGDGSLGNIIEKCELAGTALLLGEEPRVFHCH